MRQRRGWARRWPTVPGPWDDKRHNLPAPIRQLPMELVRSKLYPPFKNVTQRGVMQQLVGGFTPGFMFPWKSSQRAHAINAATAVMDARNRLEWLRDAALASTGAPPHPQTISAPPYPMASARMYPDPPPGYNIREIPFNPRSGLPDYAREMQDTLVQHPDRLSPGSPPPTRPRMPPFRRSY